MNLESRRHAVVLSGGGANGAYEIGILKALFQGRCPSTQGQPLDPFLYSGTSVGSYSAAAAVAVSTSCSGCDVGEALERLWLDRIADDPRRGGNGVFRIRGDFRPVFDPRFLVRRPTQALSLVASDTGYFARDLFQRASRFVFSAEPLERRAITSIDLSSLISVDPLRDLVRETIPLEAIRRSPKQICVAATDWSTGKLKLFGNQDFTEEEGHRAILASCAIPVFFPVVEVGGSCFVDGGVVLNTPLLPALERGADVLHVIYLDPDVENIPLEGLQNSMDNLCRTFLIMMAQHVNRDVELAEAFNLVLELSEQPGRARETERLVHKAARLLRRLGRGREARRITVHRYRPARVLSALTGILNFGRDRLEELVEEGYRDALAHDCAVAGCIGWEETEAPVSA
jgi:predicted acylesterase/phospholipase RssA